MGAERVLGVSASGRWDVGGLGWPWRVAGLVAVVLLAGVVGVGRARAALPSNCSQKGGVVTCSFSFTNFPDQTFEVPAGISSVGIVAVGAPGGPTGPRFPSPTPGGAGAVASGTVRVTGGQTLYVEVGGAGDAGFTDSAGGFNGGGMGDTAPGCGCPASGGGGGASGCPQRSVFGRFGSGSAPCGCGWRRRRRRTRKPPAGSGRCRGRSRATGCRGLFARLARRGWRRFAGHDQFLRQRRRRRRGR